MTSEIAAEDPYRASERTAGPLRLVEHVPDLLEEEHGFGGFLFDAAGRAIVEGAALWLYTTRLSEGRWDSWVRRLDLATLRTGPARRILGPEAGRDRAVLHHIVRIDGLIVGFYCDGLGLSAAVADSPDGPFTRDPGFRVRPERGWETRDTAPERWSLECNGAWAPRSDAPGDFWLGYDSYRREGRLGDLGWLRVEIDATARAVHARERHPANPLAFRDPDWACARCGGNLSSDVRVRGRRAFFYYLRPDAGSLRIGLALSEDPLFLEGVEHHVIGGPLGEEEVAEKFQAIPRGDEILLFYESRHRDGRWHTGLRRYRER